MRQSVSEENQFVVDLLTTLQKDRFSLAAWWRFLVRSWNMSCETAKNAPSLTRSWLRVTVLMSVLTCSFCITVGIFEGPFAALRLLPGFVFCIAWQQCDAFWHLGLNRDIQTGKLLPTFGIANIYRVARIGCVISFRKTSWRACHTHMDDVDHISFWCGN